MEQPADHPAQGRRCFRGRTRAALFTPHPFHFTVKDLFHVPAKCHDCAIHSADGFPLLESVSSLPDQRTGPLDFKQVRRGSRPPHGFERDEVHAGQVRNPGVQIMVRGEVHGHQSAAGPAPGSSKV